MADQQKTIAAEPQKKTSSANASGIYETTTRLVYAGPSGRETVERGQLVELNEADAQAALKACAVKLVTS